MAKIATLAAALAVIGREGESLETQATSVLRIVRAQKIGTLKDWSAAVRDAYRANGWNGKPGKPKSGAKAGLFIFTTPLTSCSFTIILTPLPDYGHTKREGGAK